MKKTISVFSYLLFALLACSVLCFNVSAAEKAAMVQNLKAEVTSTSCTLSWDRVKNCDGYRIYLVKDGGREILKTLNSNSTVSFCKEELSPNTDYTFLVRAYVLEDGKKYFGKPSEELTVKTKLSAPSLLKAEKASLSSITVSWKAVKGAEKYQLFMCPTGESAYKKLCETDKLSFTAENLSGATGYKFRVRAKRSDNSSALSKIYVFYTVPQKVTGVKTAAQNGSRVKVSWKKTSPVSWYSIYATDKKTDKCRYIGKTRETSYTFQGDRSKKTYYFSVRPVIQNDRQSLKGSFSGRFTGTTGKLSASVSENKLRKGEYADIHASSAAKYLKFSSTDSGIIKTVGKNQVRAVSTGTATLTVSDGKSSQKIKIRVTAPIFNYMSCVYDVTNEKMIFGNRMSERCYPASITKLITALVATKYMSLNSTITVGNELNMVEPLSSTCGIQRGEKFRLGDLLYGLLLPSGGDAAYTIAVNCARKVSGNPDMGYVEAKNYFVSMMNSYMKSIGATGTHCVNPHGYPVSGHYSTVHDLLLVARQVLKNPTLSKVTSTYGKYVTALTGKGRYWTTTNGLIVPYGSRYSPYAHGMKTGTVDDYYTGIISAATNSKHTIITVVIGCESYGARYTATHKLYNYYL